MMTQLIDKQIADGQIDKRATKQQIHKTDNVRNSIRTNIDDYPKINKNIKRQESVTDYSGNIKRIKYNINNKRGPEAL